jgi:uncharacterized protein (DUF4415 family)
MSTKKQPTHSDWVDPDDAPPLTREFFERATFRHGDTIIRRGRPPTGNAKQVVSLRLDQDLIARLRGLGPGWQTLAAEALRRLVANTDAAPVDPGADDLSATGKPRKAS